MDGAAVCEERGAWAIDGANTYHTRQMSRRHNPGLYAAVSNRKFTLNGNLYANFEQRSIRDVRNFAPQSLRRHDFSFSFFGNVNISPLGMSIMYHYMPELPSMLHRLDVRDAAGPLQIRLGNADLKRTTRRATWRHGTTRCLPTPRCRSRTGLIYSPRRDGETESGALAGCCLGNAVFRMKVRRLIRRISR